MTSRGKKEYAPPKVIYTEKIKARAVTCQAADDVSCAGGPITS